jgi:hypothetical protein
MMFSRKNILLNMVSCLAIVISACSMPTPTPMLDEPVRSTQLYVSTSGNDSNDCSEANPCLTLYRALGRAEHFNIIHIGPGEFLEVNSNTTRLALTLIG